MRNPILFPDRFQTDLTAGIVGEDTRTAITDLQKEQWRSRLRQSYASRVGVLAAIRSSNQSIMVLNQVLPTRLIGRFVKEEQPTKGTHGYILEGYQRIFSPVYSLPPNYWIHKLIFQYDLLQSRSSSLRRYWQFGETFGNSAVGFLRSYGRYIGISFDTDIVRDVAWGGRELYVGGALKGRNNGYVVGGTRWPSDIYDSVLRFSYDGLIETQIGAKLSIGKSHQATVGNRVYGFTAGGYNLGAYPHVTASINRLTYFGEILTPRSISLGMRRYYSSSWNPGTKDVGYFAMGGNYRRFPDDNNPLHPFAWIAEQTTERLNLNTETITQIAAVLSRPRVPGAMLSSEIKGWYVGGIQITVDYNQLSPSTPWRYNDSISTSVLNFSNESWSVLGTSLQQPTVGTSGVDNQVR